MIDRVVARLRSWDGLLLAVLVVVLILNTILVENYWHGQNQVNLWQNGIERAMVVLAMAFVIINGEIDLSVASMMGLASVIVAVAWADGWPIEAGIVAALLVGLLLGAFNGFWVAFVGLPSLVVTLAGLIGYRGLAFILIEDASIGNADTAFPRWFEDLGQQPFSTFIPFLDAIPIVRLAPFAMFLYFGMLLLAIVALSRAAFGRRTYVIGASLLVSRYSGVRVAVHKMAIMMLSGFVAALAGVMLASHLGAVRGSTATGFELDIITIVLLGGVSIFGGSGTMFGVFLATLVVLNIRNGLGLLGIPGHTQTGVIGLLLILSVLVPNLINRYQEYARRRALARRGVVERKAPAG